MGLTADIVGAADKPKLIGGGGVIAPLDLLAQRMTG